MSLQTLLWAALAVSDPGAVQTLTASTATVTVTDPLEARGLERRERFEPEDAVLFLPRVLLLAPRAVISLVAWPLRQSLRLVEKYHVVEQVEDLLYNDARTAGILPTFTGFPGAGFSGGARVFHHDLFGHQESVALSAVYGGLYTQAYHLSFSADHVGGGRLWFEGGVSYEAKPNLYFYGLGAPDEAEAGTNLDPRAAAVETRFAGAAGARPRAAGHRVRAPRPGDQGRHLARLQPPAVRARPAPPRRPAFDRRGVRRGPDPRLRRWRGHGRGDARPRAGLPRPPGRPTDGFYFEAFAGGVPPQGDWRYFHWGAEAAVYFELWGEDRVLVLRGFVEGVEGDRTRIPFADLPRLGGPYRLRGYRLNTFRDEKAALGTLEYRWRVHQFVTASLFVDAGQVNDDYLDLLKFGDDSNWKVGFGGGLRLGSETSTLLNVDVSYGDGLQVLVSTEPLQAFADRTKQL
ncbi:MAG: BamA/TamA family outer membrane protein [Deltaproteobacteria bacterium]|nr:BamA/TamA family outer membrane protein [Deltaproteobacteria bacterium]